MDGGIWSIAVIAGPVLLAVGLAYGLLKWSTRSRHPALKQARERAHEDLYERKE